MNRKDVIRYNILTKDAIDDCPVLWETLLNGAEQDCESFSIQVVAEIVPRFYDTLKSFMLYLRK